MNHTELSMLRRSLWLTREQAGRQFGMTERSWRYLEDGTRAIPADVQAGLRKLDDLANAMADAAWVGYFNLSDGLDEWTAVHAVLLVYASDADLNAAQHLLVATSAAWIGWPSAYPVEIHSAAMARARILLEGEGATVRIVAFRPDEYRAWIAAQNLPDDSASRAAWAAASTDPPPKIAAREDVAK